MNNNMVIILKSLIVKLYNKLTNKDKDIYYVIKKLDKELKNVIGPYSLYINYDSITFEESKFLKSSLYNNAMICIDSKNNTLEIYLYDNNYYEHNVECILNNLYKSNVFFIEHVTPHSDDGDDVIITTSFRKVI